MKSGRSELKQILNFHIHQVLIHQYRNIPKKVI
jgi:hypothetical protein